MTISAYERFLDACQVLVLSRFQGRPQRRVIDGGAHRGFFGRRLASHFAMIELFEPNPACWLDLERLQTQSPAQYVVHKQALGDEHTSVSLANPDAAERSFYFVKEPSVGSVPMTSLDGFSFPDVDVLKLNIEGAELLALRGALQTITRTWPVILVEEKGYGQRFGIERGAIDAFVKDLGYDFCG